MDFTLSAETQGLRQRVADFVQTEVLPLEDKRDNYDAHENIRLDLLEDLRDRARTAGLWAPQAPVDRGGMGLSMVERAVFYEEANRSLFGPVAFNCAAPDDGNINVLSQLGTEAQKDRWLQPIIDGKVRSAFAMTEPHPGGGSDPGMMLTRADWDGQDWVISGHKWFITGAEEAQHFVLLARTSDDPRRGHTAFLFDADQPGWKIERRIPIMGPEEHGGHCELIFDGLRVRAENVLLEEGRGMKVTQARLGSARLTHCMRWLGLAKRCVEIATSYAADREGFGVRLADRESVQLMLGGLAMDIEVGRLLVMKAAWEIDQGGFARKEVSMAKVQVANLLHRAADIAIQINGARGYSKDTILEWIYRYARQARLVDGADEVHRMILNRTLADEGRDFWSWAEAD